MGHLDKLLHRQKLYNRFIRAESESEDKEFWTQTYLMGIVAEIDEVLREINWQRHRSKRIAIVNRHNLAHEFADLTKYILSLWELWGFSSESVYSYVTSKSDMLDFLLQQERAEIPNDTPVVIADLDGTILDYRNTFLRWLKERKIVISDEPSSQLKMDMDLGMAFPAYTELKEQFEDDGGYLQMMAYEDSVTALHELQKRMQFHFIIHTARPVERHKRVWMDTYASLESYDLLPDKLYFGRDSRILMANELRSTALVVMLEDDPELALRAANSGVAVILRDQPYNSEVTHGNIQRVSGFTVELLADYIQ